MSASTRTALRPSGEDHEERAKGDDLATRREEEFLRLALLRREREMQAALVEAAARKPGVCCNCGAVSLAAYCDEDCRADDQARRAVQARQVRGVLR